MEPLKALETVTAPQPDGSVIWLHGLGADGHDFAPIVPELRLPPGLALRFVFPHAPRIPITINNGFVMPGWYDIRHPDLARRDEDETGIRASQRALEALIEREQDRGITPERILVAGFSQGGAIALHTALRHPERLAGVLALSTYLPLKGSLATEAAPVNRDIPIFMAHGTMDSIVLPPYAESSREFLERSGYRVEWHEYLMGHEVCAEEIDEVSRWLARCFAGSLR